MTRIRSTLATVLLMAAAAASLGIGATLAMAGLVIGLVLALAARLAATAPVRESPMTEPPLTPREPAAT